HRQRLHLLAQLALPALARGHVDRDLLVAAAVSRDRGEYGGRSDPRLAAGMERWCRAGWRQHRTLQPVTRNQRRRRRAALLQATGAPRAGHAVMTLTLARQPWASVT